MRQKIISKTKENIDINLKNKSRNAMFRKQQKNLNEEIKKIIKNEDILHKKDKISIIKTCLNISDTKRKLTDFEKKNKIKSFLNKKIEHEKFVIQQFNENLESLEKEEIKLFNNLSNVQSIKIQCKLYLFLYIVFNLFHEIS